jgi:hypothetical protein
MRTTNVAILGQLTVPVYQGALSIANPKKLYGVDIAGLTVKVSEGALYPNLGVTATKSYDSPERSGGPVI